MIGKNILQKQGFKAFIPDAFPPPGLFRMSPRNIELDAKASRLLGKLDGITQLLPDVDFFISMYIRKDATDSSQIEGTRATMIDAIEATGKIEGNMPNDVDDILHYVQALNYGVERLRDFPLSLRFLRETHEILMSDARSTHFADPGHFRKSQNWIGGKSPMDAEFVPPPILDMQRALDDLEKFLHGIDPLPPLVKSAYIHAQFETIHPFLDGNGRTGRLLIVFYLLKEWLIERPVLYLSSYFKKYRPVYYNRLQSYREGSEEKWLEFYLEGIIETAESAIETARRITLVREADMMAIAGLNKTASESSMPILQKLFAQPIVTVHLMQEWTEFRTRTGAQKMIDRFVNLGILSPQDENKKYARSYVYKKYLDIFTSH